MADNDLAAGLVGVWRLKSLVFDNGDGPSFYPFGLEPEGLIVYTKSGWMSASVMAPNRQGFSPPRRAAADLGAGQDEEIVAAFNSYASYCGTYELHPESGTISHHVYCGLLPDYVGTAQVRGIELAGDTLVHVEPVTTHTDGISRGGRVTWRRVA